jgi:photoactive yellow protein
MSEATDGIFGLFELDTAGTVKYSRIEAGNAMLNSSSGLIGLNFFDEVAPFKNTEELRQRFRYFANSSTAAEKFNFSCHFNGSPTEVKVMLTQINEREFDANSKLIILDIRKV